jgi:DNA gyrase subunit A
MLISTGGTVIKMAVDDIKRLGRSTQGVIVMRLREGETVSSLAPVVDAAEEPPIDPEVSLADAADPGLVLDEESDEEADAVDEDEPSDEG